jgi:TonB-linked SusC/RagA family outer membrane protein
MRKFYDVFRRLWVLKIPYNSLTAACMLVFVFVGLGSVNQAAAQTKVTVIGTVVDSLGAPIIGANISPINKKGAVTATDVNGKFLLDAEAGTILKISYVGYVPKQITVSATQKTYKIVLVETKNQADEVVVTAYGRKQSREAIVGSVTTVKPALLKIPASNLTNALAGQVAGVIAYTPSGQPGQDNAQFFIRGVTTFGYRQSPLILIDNVELTSDDLARLNVDDIESFSILKDASATALYGARGGNGVILVKTKEGKSGKVQITVRVENSRSQSTQTLKLADPITYMNLYNEATVTRNPLASRPFSANTIANTEAALRGDPGSNSYVYPAVDWLGLLFKNHTNTQRGNMSLQGGGGVARYYVAGSYQNDNGILRTDIRNNNNNNVKFTNYQLRSNVNINVTDKTELVVRLSGIFSAYNGPETADGGFSTDLYNEATHTSPVLFPAYFEPDSANLKAKHILFGNTAGTSTNTPQTVNPYADLLKGHKNSNESRLLAQFELNQNLEFVTQGLNFHAIFSTNRYAYFQSQMQYNPFYYAIKTYDKPTNAYTLQWINNQSGQATEYLNYNKDPSTDNLQTQSYLQANLDYSRTFAKNHTLSASLIATAQQQIYSNQKDPDLNQYTLQYSLPYRNETVAGRATYSFKSRYFLEFNFGYNGTERFSDAHRFGFFPTIGGSWIISDEKFWGDLYNVFDRVKLRASYGLVGNDQISNRRFYYVSDVNLNGGGSAAFGTNNTYGHGGVTINNYENDDVTWEKSKQLNLGLEFTFLKSFNVIAEVYQNDKYDILQNRDQSNIPSTMGLESTIAANIGKVRSKGIDISLDGKTSIGKSGFLSARANFTYAVNKITQYEEPDYNEQYRLKVGQPINRAYGYVADRLFVDDQEAANSPTQIFSTGGVPPKGGDIKYRDLNGDGKIDGADQTFLGDPNIPEIVYGFGVSGGWKGFDLSAFFQGQAKVSFFIDPARTSPFIQSPDAQFNGNTQVLQAYADNHWSEDNQNLYALYPRLGINGAIIENNRQQSSWWLRDGSFLRLKSLEFGYSLPDKIAKSLGVKKTRIYLNGLNLLTWSPFKLWDPELGGNGFAYPIQKVFNIGLNVTL